MTTVYYRFAKQGGRLWTSNLPGFSSPLLRLTTSSLLHLCAQPSPFTAPWGTGRSCAFEPCFPFDHNASLPEAPLHFLAGRVRPHKGHRGQLKVEDKALKSFGT